MLGSLQAAHDESAPEDISELDQNEIPEKLDAQVLPENAKTKQIGAQVGARVAFAGRPVRGVRAADSFAASKELNTSQTVAGLSSEKTVQRGSERESSPIQSSSFRASNSGQRTATSAHGIVSDLQTTQWAVAAPVAAASPAEFPKAIEQATKDASSGERSHAIEPHSRGLAHADAVSKFVGLSKGSVSGQPQEQSEGANEIRPAQTDSKESAQSSGSAAAPVMRDEQTPLARIAPEPGQANHGGAAYLRATSVVNDGVLQVSADRTDGGRRELIASAAVDDRAGKGGSRLETKLEAAGRASASVPERMNVPEAIAPRLDVSSPIHGAPASQMLRSPDASHGPALGGASDTFAALDSGAPATTWIHASARHAEAGYLDPALGWVGVRAETAGNMLHASIVPNSPEAAQALGGHLAGLSTFLAEHHGQAASFTLASPENGQNGGTPGQQMSGQEQHSSRNDASPNSGGEGVSAGVAKRASHEGLTAQADVARPDGWSGGHISVIA